MKAFSLLAPRMFMQPSTNLFFKPSFNASFLKKGLEKMKQEQDSKLKDIQSQNQQMQYQESELLKPNNTSQEKINKHGADPFAEASADNISNDLIQQMRQQQLEDELEFEEISKQHKQLQAIISKECDIPFKVYGMLKMPKTKAAFMPERVFAEQRIPKYMVIDHLKKIYLGTLHSIVELDEEFLNEYLEPTFAKKLIERVKELKNQGFKLELYQDNNGIRGEPITQETYLGDMVMIRGLSVDRTKNLSQNEYHMWKDIDDMGLVVYTPRYLSNPEEFIDPEKNKTMYDEYKKVILRVLVYLKNPYRIRIIRPNGTPIEVDDSLYSWEHIALFETQMRAPPQFKSDYKLENYMEWLGKFNFGVWRMADMDNWNLGNPLIVKDSDRDKFRDEIFKDSKYDPEYNIDIKNV